MKSDPINPSHYNDQQLAPIEFLDANGMAEHFCIGNVIKYTMRARRKNGAEDYKKAIWYLQFLVAKDLGMTGAEAQAYAAKMTRPLSPEAKGE